jgi:hypothetical protein
MQQTENQVAPSVAFDSTSDSVGIVPLDDQILAQVVGGVAALGPGAGWLVSSSGPGNGW